MTGVQTCALPICFPNRPFEVKHFQTIHHCSVDVAHGLALLFGIGTNALPLWDSRTRRNNLWVGLAVTLSTAVRFEKGEPFCHIMPARRGEIESVEPELCSLSDNPELKRQHDTWTANRNRFNVDLRQPGSEAQAEKWQKLYHRGVMPDGEAAGTADHRTRLKVRPFKKPGAG